MVRFRWRGFWKKKKKGVELTDYHDGEVETLLDRLAVDLIRQVSKSNVPLQLFAESAAQQGLFKGMIPFRRWEARLARVKSYCLLPPFWE